jgi:hypothetical protein
LSEGADGGSTQVALLLAGKMPARAGKMPALPGTTVKSEF